MISAALAAFLVLQTAVEPSKPAEPRTYSAVPEPTREISPAGVERLERMSRMSSEERAQVLADLPAPQRERIEKGLERLDGLSPDQRQQWFNRYRVFNQLPPQQKDAVRSFVKELLTLPVPRRKAVRQELETYKHMPISARQARMRSADFKNKFTAEEREIIHHSGALLREPAGAPVKP